MTEPKSPYLTDDMDLADDSANGLPPFVDASLPYFSQTAAKHKLTTSTSDHDLAYSAWKKAPTPENRGKLMQAVLPTIDSAVKGYGNDAILRGQAKLLASQAFDTYDPAKGDLKTHLTSSLQGLARRAGQNAQAIHIPERIVLEQTALRQSEKELESQLGRNPTDAEISEHSRIALKRMKYIRQASTGVLSSSLKDDDGGDYSPASAIPGQTRYADMWQDLVYADLSPTDKSIMEHTLGLNGRPPLANNAIAAKLGLSPGAISQRKAKIQALLDERYNSSSFGD